MIPRALAGRSPRPHAPGMFVVTEADAAAIRAAFEQRGELSAAIELRRLFQASPIMRKPGSVPGRLPHGSRCPWRHVPPGGRKDAMTLGEIAYMLWPLIYGSMVLAGLRLITVGWSR
jgi:hypothetical protein